MFEEFEDATDEELRSFAEEELADLADLPQGHPDAPDAYSDVGFALLELYQRQWLARDLDEAVAALERALAEAPDDPDTPGWRLALGSAYAYRFEAEQDATDLERATEELGAGLAEIDDVPAADRADMTVGLAQLWWGRYNFLADNGRETSAAEEALETAISWLDEAAAIGLEAGTAEEYEHAVDCGLAYGARFRRHGDRADLDTAITHLARAVCCPEEAVQEAGAEGFDEDADVPAMRCELGYRYTDRFYHSGDPQDLVRSVAELDGALDGAGPLGAAPRWLSDAREVLGYARAKFWQLRRQSADSTAPAQYLGRLVCDATSTGRPAGKTLAEYGRQLHEKWSREGRGDDHDQAVRWLQEAAETWDLRQGSRWVVLWDLALARWDRFRRDGDPAELDRAAEVLTEVATDVHDSCLHLANALGGLVWGERLRHERASMGDATLFLRASMERIERMRAQPDEGAGNVTASLSQDALPSRLRMLVGSGEVAEVARSLDFWTELNLDDQSDREAWDKWVTHLFRPAVIQSLIERGSIPYSLWPRFVEALRAVLEGEAANMSPQLTRTMNFMLEDMPGADEQSVAEAFEDFSTALDEERFPRLRDVFSMGRAMFLSRRGELRGAADDLDSSTTELRRLLDSDILPDGIRAILEPAARGQQPESRISYSEHPPTVAAELERTQGLPASHRVGAIVYNAAFHGSRAVGNRDLDGLDRVIALFEKAVELADPGSDQQPGCAAALGAFYRRRATLTDQPSDIDESIGWLERAAEEVDHPGHRLWTPITVVLAEAYRARGREADRGRSRELGLQGLRGHAWRAVLQSGTGDAVTAAGAAVDPALAVAGWCVNDGVAGAAVQALDACRGLVLHAATVAASVPEQLIAAGYPELAEEWRQHGHESEPDPASGPLAMPERGVSSDLRFRALRAMVGSDELALGESGSAATRLLDPPDVREIAAALRSAGADAVVYLAPTDKEAGVAVVVPARGDPTAIPLPDLHVDAAELAAYADAGHRSRDAGPASATSGPDRYGADTLGEVCTWAWSAAMGPLLEHLRSRGFPDPPRLVVVPMGQLGLVPWHAARTAGPDGRWRYAVQEAVISYAASGRLFCEVMGRDAVPADAEAMVVGNPTGDLGYAGAEAQAIHDAFYPGGRYLGRRDDQASAGDGTPEEVLTWVREHAAEGGGVLHLACHGVVDPNQRYSAYLRLAGGRQLPAEYLTEQAQSPGLAGALGVVVLAACTTNISGRGYDDAYSLSTAFLVAGARSVFGSLWPVPDEATSVLMFMVHHYLRAERRAAAVALRLAQLWVLDPDRRVPATMPAHLAARVPLLDPDDLSGWAGFADLGQ